MSSFQDGGAFLTGVGIAERVPSKKSLANLDAKPENKKLMVPQTAQNRSRQQINLPNLAQTTKHDSSGKAKLFKKDFNSTRTVLRVSTSEKEFRNPLFKKLDGVKSMYLKELEKKEQEKKKAQESVVRSKEKYDDENNLRKTHNFADTFNDAIGEDYKNLYEYKEAEKMGNITKKKHFLQSIEKQELKLQQEKKKHDNIKYEIMLKQKVLAGLQKKKRDYQIQLEDNAMMKETRQQMVAEIMEKENQTNKESYESECRAHMIGIKKHDLLCIEKKIAEQKKELRKKNFELQSKNKGIILTQEAGDRINYQKIKAEERNKFAGERFDPDFEEQLNDEVSEFEDKRRLQQIMDHERILEMNKERRKREEIEQRRQQQIQRELDEEAERQKHAKKYMIQKEEDVKHAKDFIVLTGAEISDQYNLNQQDPFHDLKKLREDLTKHLNQLDEEINKMEKSREDQELEYEKLRIKKREAQDELEKSRYEKDRLKPVDIYGMDASKEELLTASKEFESRSKTMSEADKKRRQDILEAKRKEEEELMLFQKDAGMDELENMLIKSKNECNRIEDEVKRINKTLYEAFTSISRIMCQIQKKKVLDPIDSKDVDKVLSICGLKLERMLTLVIKKRRTFFMESINTDGTIREGGENYPPPYMGPIYDNHARKKKNWEREDEMEQDSDADFDVERQKINEQIFIREAAQKPQQQNNKQTKKTSYDKDARKNTEVDFEKFEKQGTVLESA